MLLCSFNTNMPEMTFLSFCYYAYKMTLLFQVHSRYNALTDESLNSASDTNNTLIC